MERETRDERMDDPALAAAELRRSLLDLRRLNRLGRFGARFARTVLAHLPAPDGDRAALLCDLGTGTADLPAAVIEAAEATGLRVRVLAVDTNHRSLRFARAQGLPPGVFPVVADARRLPLRDGGVAVVFSSLFLHHLPPGEETAVLRESARVSSGRLVMSDLRRGRLRLGLVWLAARLFARSPVTHEDAPLSVRRSLTLAEVRHVAAHSGLARFTARRQFPVRWLLTTRGERP